MKLVRFDLSGKLAHFRRFYSNSSSLTYPIPPPTALAGVVGGALGLAPGEYPLRLRELRYSVQPPARWRTLMQTINLLFIKGQGDVTGAKGHTQVPTQFLAPYDLSEELTFRILLASDSTELIEQITGGLLAPTFPPYLGVAYCLGHVDSISVADGELVGSYRGNTLGALLRERVVDVRLKEGQRVLRDRYPLRLDSGRNLMASGDLLVEARGQPLDVTTTEVLQVGDQEVYALI